MLVLLDTTILTNFALVGLTSIPIELWGNQTATTAEVLEEYAAGVETLKLPRENWTYPKIITLSSDEQVLGIRMFSKLGMGEGSCLAVSMIRGAMLATDDQLARRSAKVNRIELIGTVGILKACVQSGLLSQLEAQQKLEEMIAAGYYSPVSKLDTDYMKRGESSTELNPTTVLRAPSELVIAKSISLDYCPAAVYLAQLKQSSRRPQKQALD